MAVKINWNKVKHTLPAFGDIYEDEYFLYNDDLYIKIDPVYAADELESEVDNYHEINESSDIDSIRYNCYCVNDPCYLYLDDTTIVSRVDVEISITPKGERA
jgi:hypothetical protein